MNNEQSRPDFEWLNETSRVFLQRGYLKEGVVAENRIREIAEHAEKLLNIEGFADKFYHYMARGYYSLSSPVWANFGLKRGLPISCVSGETWINTIDGGKQAKDIKLGDLVLTHKNRYRPVTAVIPTKQASDIYKLKVSSRMTNLYITGNHPVLTNLGWVRVDELDPDQHFVAVNDGSEPTGENNHDAAAGIKWHDGLTYCPIRVLEKTDRVEDVYDFTVDEDHSFSCAGVVVHNCFGSAIADNMGSIIFTNAEVKMMNRFGGGASAYLGRIRPRGAEITDNGSSNGSFPWLEDYETGTKLVSQGNCYEDGTEVLTNNGFKRFQEVNSETDKLAQVDEYNRISYTDEYELVVKDYQGDLIYFQDTQLDLIDIGVTPNHRMVAILPHLDTTKTSIISAEDLERRVRNNPEFEYTFFTAENKSISSDVINITRDYYQGKVHCAIVPHGRLVVRGKTGLTLICGNTRRGQFAGYIDVEHADINEWLDVWTEGNPIQSITYGVVIGQHWWDEMKAGDIHKKKIWAKILQRRGETGIPYILFRDNVNEQKPKVYKDKNMQIHASNLCCFVGETLVSVRIPAGDNVPQGMTYVSTLTIREIAEHFEKGNPYPIYAKGYLTDEQDKWVEHSDNDEDYHLVTNGVRTKNDKVIRVTLNDGSSFECTEDHQLALAEGGYIRADQALGKVLKGGISFQTITTLAELDAPALKVVSVEPSREHVAVYDITVKYTHNFMVVDPNTKSEVLVHNCEIALPANEEESFVCCLSSMNLLHWEEWKNTDAVKTLAYFLEAVLTDFIDKVNHLPYLDKFFMSRALRFAERHRAIGIGALGWHSFLQSKMVPFESFEAMMYNSQIFKYIMEQTHEASREMAERYGEPDVLKGYGMRHTTTTAVAPTKSSSAILGGVSPSIEPFKSNIFTKDLAKVKMVFKNPYLEKVLEKYGKNTDETWQDLMMHDGSVQHLPYLTKHEKDVFKTFSEISQLTIIQQAASRQKFIDQGQSINVMIHPDTPLSEIHKLYETAMELGVKGLYYQFGISKSQEYNRGLLTSCASCES